jgi:hypothetical protein
MCLITRKYLSLAIVNKSKFNSAEIFKTVNVFNTEQIINIAII